MKTIAWDIDDVLNDLMGRWLESYKKKTPDCKVSYPELLKNPPNEIVGISMQDYLSSLDSFRVQNYLSLSPNPQILGWMKNNSKDFMHIAITSTPMSCAHLSSHWLFKNFGEWIRSFTFIPSKRSADTHPAFFENKADFLKTQNIYAFIDDNEANISAAKKEGIRAILYPRPWNSQSADTNQILNSIKTGEF